jgi:acetylornithine deacetylase/succinyl-diaminopimelate desuccinylase-like protein
MLSDAFLEVARKLIAADSVTDRGNLPAVRVLEGWCDENGFSHRRIASRETPDRDANLLVGPIGGGDTEVPPLLFVTHLDTVAPGPRDRWRTDPFTLTVAGDRAFGLGVADVKLDALCKLFALRRIDPSRLSRSVYFLGTFGEEAGLRGAREFIADRPFMPAFVFCGEPCRNRLHSAHKGYAMVAVSLRSQGVRETFGPSEVRRHSGRAAHSSTPHLGINAIDLALDAAAGEARPITAIRGGSGPNTVPAECDVTLGGEGRDLRSHLSSARAIRELWHRLVHELQPIRDDRFAPPEAVSNATVIEGESGWIRMILDARLLPEHDPERLLSHFISEAGVLVSSGLSFDVEVLRRATGMSIDADAPIVRMAGEVLSSMGLDPTPVAKPTSTEGGVFARAGVPVLVFGPSPTTGNAHTPNEQALLGEVARAIDVYEALTLRFCGESA